MPYRRLPNTDAARLKALNKAYDKGRDIPPFRLAFSQSAFQKVQSFLTMFKKAMDETKQAYTIQVKKNKDYIRVQKKAKLYISHFIQVVNMAIQRGDLPDSERTFFGISENLQKIPSLNSESDLIKWGEQILHGEERRKSRGLSPITNPTAAVVRVRYEQFLDAYKFQKTLQKNYQRSQESLAGLRKEADEIIQQVWNEVEASFHKLQDDDKRKNAEEYGLSYVFRKNELKKITTVESPAREV